MGTFDHDALPGPAQPQESDQVGRRDIPRVSGQLVERPGIVMTWQPGCLVLQLERAAIIASRGGLCDRLCLQAL